MLEPFGRHVPKVDPTAYVHHTATIIGEVTVGPRANIWPGVVLRGDEGVIEIGEETNIQDLTLAHNTGGFSTTHIGPRITVGHRAILHGCTIEGDCLIGMGAILLDHCVIEPWCIIGAGSLIPKGRRIPEGSMVMGMPGKVVREITEFEREYIKHGHRTYLQLAEESWRPESG
ncbi:MAG: gamma carbonic anhydrase family protein [Myxococcota bacterium]|jgi:carbonic anhydrase/acetyltransferase-like protein (isoleucine patch superfamily)|nr:gamma carbonic anhydrase family protein [Myxococcota bacterium]